MRKISFFFLWIFCLSCGGGSGHETSTVNLAWDPHPDADVVGYKAFVREEDEKYDYDNPVWQVLFWDTDTFCRDSPTCDVDVDLYVLTRFVVKAVNIKGEESCDSNEASYYPPPLTGQTY